MERQISESAATEYLAAERKADAKNEFRDGEVCPMPDASREHCLITASVAGELWASLKSQPFDVYLCSMRLKVSATGLYTYPDVSVVDGQPLFENEQEDTLLNPTVLVEVLSPSTADYDRGAKFEHYRALPSIREFLLVDQHRAHVMHYRRQDDGTWLLAETRDLDDTIRLPSLEVELKMAEIYARVDFSGDSGPRELKTGQTNPGHSPPS